MLPHSSIEPLVPCFILYCAIVGNSAGSCIYPDSTVDREMSCDVLAVSNKNYHINIGQARYQNEFELFQAFEDWRSSKSPSYDVRLRVARMTQWQRFEPRALYKA